MRIAKFRCIGVLELYPPGLILDELAGNQIEVIRAIHRFDGLAAACEKSIILSAAAAGEPAVKIEGHGAVGGDPFTVIFSGKVQMCGIREAAFTGRVSNSFACEKILTNPGTVFCGDVHV